jgi:hypothetical protein
MADQRSDTSSIPWKDVSECSAHGAGTRGARSRCRPCRIAWHGFAATGLAPQVLVPGRDRRRRGFLQELAAAGFPFLVRRVGGWGHGGAALTSEGRACLTSYDAFRVQVDTMVQQAFAASFPPRGSFFCCY